MNLDAVSACVHAQLCLKGGGQSRSMLLKRLDALQASIEDINACKCL